MSTPTTTPLDLSPNTRIHSPIDLPANLTQFDLSQLNLAQIPSHLVNHQIIRNQGIIPVFQQDNYLFVAMDEAKKLAALKTIEFETGLECRALWVETSALNALIHQFLHRHQITNLLGDSQHAKAVYDAPLVPEVPLVQFVDKIILDAIHQGVSDIHFEPYEQAYRIRYRLDGILTEVEAPTQNFASRINSRLKVMAQLDITEHRLPQDGHFNLPLPNGRTIHVRVSTCPTVNGEKIVLRILDPLHTTLGIHQLGFHSHQESQFLRAIDQPQGMILITGPTGSGKTLTLYTALHILNCLERNISTVEDPVEMRIAGINQIGIDPKIGLNFVHALRSLLRQDPDVLMIGEIRDTETAEAAIKAAQTGHLVLSSLHANTALATLPRLLNLGVSAFDIVNSVNLIVAQRLVRQLCVHCKQIAPKRPEDEKNLLQAGFIEDELATLTLYQPQGCHHCLHGYRGRIGLFEMLPLSGRLNELLLAGAHPTVLLQQAQKEGMTTLYQAGLRQMKAGKTSLAEINRVVGAMDCPQVRHPE